MELNGIAHIQLTVSNFAACAAFYEKLLHFFEIEGTADIIRAWLRADQPA